MELVLFDLDNTLLAGDSDFEWAQFLISQGRARLGSLRSPQPAVLRPVQGRHADIFEFLDFQLKPWPPQPRPARRLAPGVHGHRVRPMMTPKAQALVKQHLDSGAVVAIVTATNSFVTGPIARPSASRIWLPPFRPRKTAPSPASPRHPAFKAGKIERVEAWLESLGLCWESFAKSSFYSDSHNDLPLMNKVGNPVAVDPDDTLRPTPAITAGGDLAALNHSRPGVPAGSSSRASGRCGIASSNHAQP